MSVILPALLGSYWVRVVGGIFIGLLALKGYGLAKELQGASRGRAEVTQAVTKKADADVKTAGEVAVEAAAGKGKTKNPYMRPE